MNVSLLKCKECGKVYAFEKLEPRDRHHCKCGVALDIWSNYNGKCEVEKIPNEPYKKEIMARQNHREPKFPTKGITIEIDCKLTEGFNDAIEELREAQQQLASPIIITDKAKALLFQSDRKLPLETIDRLRTVFNERLGVECVIVDSGTKLVGVIER